MKRALPRLWGQRGVVVWLDKSSQIRGVQRWVCMDGKGKGKGGRVLPLVVVDIAQLADIRVDAGGGGGGGDGGDRVAHVVQ